MIRARDLRVACGLDWGSASPGVCLWACALPDGHVHVFDELKYQRQTVQDVADLIKAKHREWRLDRFPPIYCDPALKAQTGQIGEDYLGTFARHGLGLTPVSNHRPAGWQRLHEALSVDPATGTPWLTIHARCRYLIRTLPLMIQAKHDPEDIDTETDDHAADALRYLLQGGIRPGTKAQIVQTKPGSWGWFKSTYLPERVA